LKIGFWKLLVIYDLMFVIQILLKSLCSNAFIEYLQKVTCQILIWFIMVAKPKEIFARKGKIRNAMA